MGWALRSSGNRAFCAVLEGSCRLAVDGVDPITLEAGDFVLLPATPGFTMTASTVTPVPSTRRWPHADDEIRHGSRRGPADVRLLGGAFVCGSPDAALLVSLLPTLMHVRGVERLSVLVRLGQGGSERRRGRQLDSSRRLVKMLWWSVTVAIGRGCASGIVARPGRCSYRASDAARYTAIPRARGPWHNSQRRRRFRARPCSRASRAQLDGRRWNFSSPGAWPSPKICFAIRTWGSPRLPNEWGTAQRAPSARRSAVTWDRLRVDMRARS